MAKRFDIEKFNHLLEIYNQETRAIKISNEKIELSNGVVLISESDIRKCKRRVMNEQYEFISRFDLIYQIDRVSGQKYETEARAATSRKGGIACQRKHGEKIRENLNTGEPWNRGKTLYYDVWNKGLSKDFDLRMKSISESRKGSGNPMYGVKHTDEYKQIQSQRMKALIKEGKFTPNSNNQNTHWDALFEDKRYRSSWEAIYQYHHPEALYENLRLMYNYAGNEYVYIVDFVDYDKKIAIEVKPESGFDNQKTKAKISALQEWCNKNGFLLLLADEKYLHKLGRPKDLSCFDENTRNKVEKFYETGKKNSS